ncbi:hypothetical protein Tco_0529459 [Tanacetum coccineum]
MRTMKDDLLDMIKIEYMHEDGDVFEDHSWEDVYSNGEKVYREWCLEFFSMMYVNRKVNQDEIIREKCIWFRLCRKEHVFTLLEFAVLLGLYSESDIQHRLFEIHFLRIMTNDKGFNHAAYWSRIGQPITRKRRHNENMAWILAEYLSKRAPGITEISEIYGGHFVTKIARRLRFYNQRALAKCSKSIKSESWDDRMFGKALDRRAKKLSLITLLEGPPQASNVPREEPSVLNSSWGDWNASLNDIERRDVWCYAESWSYFNCSELKIRQDCVESSDDIDGDN